MAPYALQTIFKRELYSLSLMDNTGTGRCSLTPLHRSVKYLFIHPPDLWFAESPGRENALSHWLYLLVLD